MYKFYYFDSNKYNVRTMVKKDISVEAFQRWTLKAKEKWNKDKSD